MDCGDWITLAAVVVALGIGVAAILHTRSLQKKERKERLLKEIIEWAIDIKAIHKDIAGIREKVMQEKVKQQESMTAHIGIIKDSFIRMRGRNQYTSSIAMKAGKTVKESVTKLIKEMESYITLLYEWETIIMSAMDKGTAVDDTEEFNEADYKEDFIEELANEVIDEAAKIRAEL